MSDGSVGKVNYNAIYQMDGSDGWGGKAELNAQPLRKLMPSADKFVVGMDNVRAYKPGAAVGDAGMSLNLDIYKTTYIEVDEAGTKVLTQPYFFFDSAVVYDGSADFSSKHFKAFGYGIKLPFFAAYKGFSFDLFRAHALSNSANRPSGARLGFSLNYLY